MSYDFGKSITRSFYPLEDGEPVNLPSQAPSIFLFEEQPNRADAALGLGAFSTIQHWTESATSPYARTYSIPPIYDPAPSSATMSRGYWEAINFVHAGGGQTQTILRQFDVERTVAPPEMPGTTRADVVAAFPALPSYLDNDEIDDFIDQAMTLMKVDIEKKGYAWGSVQNLGKTKLALAYRAVAESARSQIKEENDRFFIRYKMFRDDYYSLLGSIMLDVDSDGDGAADTVVTPNTVQVITDH